MGAAFDALGSQDVARTITVVPLTAMPPDQAAPADMLALRAPNIAAELQVLEVQQLRDSGGLRALLGTVAMRPEKTLTPNVTVRAWLALLDGVILWRSPAPEELSFEGRLREARWPVQITVVKAAGKNP
jgi:hypothetical protein